MRSSMKRLMLFIFLGFLALLLVSCNHSDTKKIQKALEDRLTDSLAFDNATAVEGDPPPANSDGSVAPQVTAMDAPETLAMGQSFSLWITTDFADYASIAGAVVHVQNADHYLKITQSMNEPTRMELTGKLLVDEELGGHEFTIRIAFRKQDGTVGNYWSWKLNVPVLHDDTCISGNKRCNGNLVEICEEGAWTTYQKCQSGYTCISNECQPGGGDNDGEGDSPTDGDAETVVANLAQAAEPQDQTTKTIVAATPPAASEKSDQTPTATDFSIFPVGIAKKDRSDDLPLGQSFYVYVDYQLAQGSVTHVFIHETGALEYAEYTSLQFENQAVRLTLNISTNYSNTIGDHGIEIALGQRTEGSMPTLYVSNYLTAVLHIVQGAATACNPNPCAEPHKTVCATSADPGGYTCSCDAGYELGTDSQACVESAADACNPNPCTEAHKTVCTVSASPTGYVCYCDSGYQLDTGSQTCEPISAKSLLEYLQGSFGTSILLMNGEAPASGSGSDNLPTVDLIQTSPKNDIYLDGNMNVTLSYHFSTSAQPIAYVIIAMEGVSKYIFLSGFTASAGQLSFLLRISAEAVDCLGSQTLKFAVVPSGGPDGYDVSKVSNYYDVTLNLVSQ